MVLFIAGSSYKIANNFYVIDTAVIRSGVVYKEGKHVSSTI